MLERLARPGPKRILALDGGGIRGALSIGYLSRIEELMRQRLGKPDLVLRDYFDLIGGTSTGSAITAGLAIGMSTAEVVDVYRQLGPRVFGSKRRMLGKLRAVFDAGELAAVLETHLGDRTLGDESITTGLCIVTKRADTHSTWPLLNHPDGQFYEANRDILLRTAVRASTAAPFFFVPEGIEVGAGGGLGAFIDGGVSMANNPALLLFLITTLDGFPFHWSTGRDDIFLVSVGSGVWSAAQPAERVLNHRLWNWAVEVPTMLIEDGVRQSDLVLRSLGWTPRPTTYDSEVGDMSTDFLGGEPLLTYIRYDARLDEEGLAEVKRGDLTPRLPSLRQIAVGTNVDDLLDLGRAFADLDIDDNDFPAVFDAG